MAHDDAPATPAMQDAFDASAFLRHAVQVELPLSYFRDITHSTRRLFVR